MTFRHRFYDLGTAYVIADARDFRRSLRPADASLERVPRHDARWLVDRVARREPQLFARLCETLLGIRPSESRVFALTAIANMDALLARMVDAFGSDPPADAGSFAPDAARFYLLRERRREQALTPPPDSPEGQRVALALAKFGGGPLVHRGVSYRLQRVGRFDSALRNRDAYETLSEAQLFAILREVCSEPAVDPHRRAAVEELLAAAEAQRARQRKTDLVLLRRHRVYVRAESSEPPLTPSQLRKAREAHWVEIVLTDRRLGPLAGEAFEITLPDGRKQQATTNERGMYRVEGLPGGSCRIRFRPAKGHSPKSADTGWSKLELGVTLSVDERHELEVDHNRTEIIEIDDAQFCAYSSALVPNDAAQWGLDGLSAVAHALRYASENASRKLMIVGHADPEEAERAALANRRAKVVEALLKGDAQAFVAACVDPEQQATPSLLSWAHERHSYGCDPNLPVTARANQRPLDSVQAALVRFRQSHNQRETTQLDETVQGMVEDDYAALFTLFERSLADLLDVERSELSTLRNKLTFHSASTLAADTEWPTPGENRAAALRSRSSRRVDLMFLENDHPIPGIDATAISAEHFFVDERRVRRTYLAPRVPLVVVTPYTSTDVDRGVDAEFKLVGPGYSRTIKVSERCAPVMDFFDVRYVELQFNGVPSAGKYKLTTIPKGGAESVVFEGVPFEELLDGAMMEGAA